MDVRIDEQEKVLTVDDDEEAHVFDIVDDQELAYRTSDDTSDRPPDDVVERLETDGYIVRP